jgi:hypothetical protein
MYDIAIFERSANILPSYSKLQWATTLDHPGCGAQKTENHNL